MYNSNYRGFDYTSAALGAGSTESTRNCERQSKPKINASKSVTDNQTV